MLAAEAVRRGHPDCLSLDTRRQELEVTAISAQCPHLLSTCCRQKLCIVDCLSLVTHLQATAHGDRAPSSVPSPAEDVLPAEAVQRGRPDCRSLAAHLQPQALLELVGRLTREGQDADALRRHLCSVQSLQMIITHAT